MHADKEKHSFTASPLQFYELEVAILLRIETELTLSLGLD